MPYYHVQHATPLSDEQQDKIAASITRIHTELFNAPAIFVNVEFTEHSKAKTYVAGKRRVSDKINAYIRVGPSRTREHYAKLSSAVDADWKKIVGGDGLAALFVHATIVGGLEQGFDIPEAGKDAEWMKENYLAFQKKAQAGNEDFQELVQEIKTRPCFSDVASSVNGHA